MDIYYIAIAAKEVSTNQGFKSVVPKTEIGSEYVYYFLNYNLVLIESMASESTFKEVSGGVMENIPALIPDLKVVRQFSKIASKFDLCIKDNEKQIEILTDIETPSSQN
jgi:type I restriction enzyme S subunit